MGVDPDADADARNDATTCVDTILRSWLASPSGKMRRSETVVGSRNALEAVQSRDEYYKEQKHDDALP